jgi:hypothetical protein
MFYKDICWGEAIIWTTKTTENQLFGWTRGKIKHRQNIMWSLAQKMTVKFVRFPLKIKSFAMVFLRYLICTWRNLSFSLIYSVNFYYIINKLIILVLKLN